MANAPQPLHHPAQPVGHETREPPRGGKNSVLLVWIGILFVAAVGVGVWSILRSNTNELRPRAIPTTPAPFSNDRPSETGNQNR